MSDPSKMTQEATESKHTLPGCRKHLYEWILKSVNAFLIIIVDINILFLLFTEGNNNDLTKQSFHENSNWICFIHLIFKVGNLAIILYSMSCYFLWTYIAICK